VSQQPTNSRMAVLMFNDIVESMALEGRLGTEGYSRLLKLHHQVFQQVLKLVGEGAIRNDTGDGMLSEFNTAANAVNAALLFQMRLRETEWETEAPQVRIGIHQGQIQFDPASGKIMGMPVSIAARVMGLAQARQILMTRPVFDDARQFIREHPGARPAGPPPPAIEWKAHGEYLLKGINAPLKIFEVGAVGFAPLRAPPAADKARAAVSFPEPRPLKWRPEIGAALAVLCGLVLWATPLGQAWENASYDNLFRFGNRPTALTNVVLIQMDNAAYDQLDQKRGSPYWNRAWHARLLNQLKDDGCPLVVFDVFFETNNLPDQDQAAARALRRHGGVVLMADLIGSHQPRLDSAKPVLPYRLFADAATNWGIGHTDAENLQTVRRHWPFPAPVEGFPSLPWKAAQLAGARLNETPEKQWLRYYGSSGGWEVLSYHVALSNTPGYFSNKIVFIGNKPGKSDPTFPEDDKFCTPYTPRTKEAVGGVEIMATEFLNLMNGDWLRRPAGWLETLVLVLSGIALGESLCRLRLPLACGVAFGVALAVMLGAASWSYFTNYWFPWLVIAGGQAPCALAWALVSARWASPKTAPAKTVVVQVPEPEIPDYKLIEPPFAKGAFGEVWLAQSAIGQWQALKKVYRKNFEDERPYDWEFEGIRQYKPVSEQHSGLLRVELVSRKKPQGYFYYVMELADAMYPGWEKKPAAYKPRSLENLRAQAYGHRLPVRECVEIAVRLCEALQFLHDHDLTHRDVKPSNVIFVQGRPKLADVGLVTGARAGDRQATRVGTPGFMPPEPEPLGTKQADIYSLGMVLYVTSTGRDPVHDFRALSGTLTGKPEPADLLRLNEIILKACQPERARRYQSVGEMRAALLEVQKGFAGETVRGQGHTPE
jgi:class 3 adenylate cyclase/CHASE2 domain-containing sensor protein